MECRKHSSGFKFLALIVAFAAVLCMLLAYAQTPALAEETKNLALTGKPSASGTEVAGGQWGPNLAFDGDAGQDRVWREISENFRSPLASRWSANSADDVWLAIDLGAEANIDNVVVTWGKQYGTSYTIETSADGSDWKPYGDPITQTSPSEEVTTKTPGLTARHVRVHVTSRNSQWPVGIWEFEVNGSWVDEPPLSAVDLPSVIPAPVSYEAAEGDPFVLDPHSQIVASGDAAVEAEKLAQTLRVSTGFALPVVAAASNDKPAIILTIENADENSEAYSIEVNSGTMTVKASSAHGLFNGIQTIYQLFGSYSVASFETNGPWSVPALRIEDRPRFEYRGIMLDPARSFLTVDEIKQSIRVMALHKYSYLHLHLVDDQGWRIEITNKGREPGDTIDYTRLTSISSKTAMGTTQQQAKEGITGYYTQDDLREIVAYAKQYHIEVVPEIDMPGHSQAMLHAIPQLNTEKSSHNGTVDADGNKITDSSKYICAPNQATGAVGNSYLDPESQATWTFLKHVVKQVSEITDSEYFHIGGDETHQMDEKHPGTAGPFLTKAAAMVRDMGLKPVGWNEWANGGGEIKSGDIFQYWTGDKAPLQNQVNQNGAKAIFSSAANAYFPQKAGESIWGATWATGGLADLSHFYNYNPAAALGISEDALLGVEGAMWSEHVRGIQDFFFPAYPRAMALAEVGWTPQAVRAGKLNNLKVRIDDLAPMLTLLGADFYAEDGLKNTSQVAGADMAVDETSTAPFVVGYGYSPMTATDAVSATITFEDGTTRELSVAQDREYKEPNPNNNNNRAQNGIWKLSLDELPEGIKTQTATIIFTAQGATATDTILIDVKEEEEKPHPGEPGEPGEPQPSEPDDERDPSLDKKDEHKDQGNNKGAHKKGGKYLRKARRLPQTGDLDLTPGLYVAGAVVCLGAALLLKRIYSKKLA